MTRDLLIRYIEARRTPITQVADAAELHSRLLAGVAAFYQHSVTDPLAHLSHKREALARLLDHPASAAFLAGLPARLHTVPALEALAVLEIIALRRINRHRAQTLVLDAVLGHPSLAELAATRRQRTVRLLRHALGERAWSAVRSALQPGVNGHGTALLERHIWPHVPQQRRDSVREALAVLLGVPVEPISEILKKRLAVRTNLDAGQGLPRETLFGLRGTFHQRQPASRVRYLAPAATVRQTDGPMTDAFKRGWQEGETVSVAPARQQYRLPSRLAVVLDLSASMASTGERAYHPAALGLAIYRQLTAQVSATSHHQVGGSVALEGDVLPGLVGATDLAAGILDAARTEPEAIVVISDGYENARTGDAAQVAAGLKKLRPSLTLMQVLPRFTPAESLEERRLSVELPLVPIDHENDVSELLARIVLAHADEQVSADELDQLSQLLFARGTP